MEKFKEKLPIEEQPNEGSEKFDGAEDGESGEWEKELEGKKQEHRQEEELDKLIKKMRKEKNRSNKKYLE